MNANLIDRLDTLAAKMGPIASAFETLGSSITAAVSRLDSAASKLAAVFSARVLNAPQQSVPPGVSTANTNPSPSAMLTPGGGTVSADLHAAFVKAFAPLRDTLARVAGVVTAATSAKAAPTQGQLQAASTASRGVGQAAGSAIGGAVGGPAGAAVGGAVGGKAGGAIGDVFDAAKAGPIGLFNLALGQALAPLNALTNAISAAASKVAPFVAALNPSSVMVFDRAMRDLQATIGVALQPVLQGLTQVARDAANALLPLMRQLAPVVKAFMDVFTSVFKVWINAVVAIVTPFVPVLKALADIVSAIAPVFQTLYAGFMGMVSAISGAVGGILKAFGVGWDGAVSSFRTALQTLTKAALTSSASFLKFFSTTLGNNFIDGVKAALVGGKDDANGSGAPKNAAVTNLQEFGRAVMQSALLAGPDGGQDKKTEDWLKDVVKSLDEIRADNSSMFGKAVEAIVRVVHDSANNVIRAVTPAVYTRPTNP